MKMLNPCIAAFLACACASGESARRPAASARTEPAPRRNSATEPTKVQLLAVPNDSRDSSDSSDSKRPTKLDHAAAVPPPREADNTRQNQLDRDNAVKPVTPLDQGNHTGDLEITRKIREAVIGDDSLSFQAKNVKIISQGGDVTLRGSVDTAAEKRTIEMYSRQVVGAGHVHNQLAVDR